MRAEYDVPAVGIALVGPDGPVWVDAIGKADLEAAIAELELRRHYLVELAGLRQSDTPAAK